MKRTMIATAAIVIMVTIILLVIPVRRLPMRTCLMLGVIAGIHASIMTDAIMRQLEKTHRETLCEMHERVMAERRWQWDPSHKCKSGPK